MDENRLGCEAPSPQPSAQIHMCDCLWCCARGGVGRPDRGSQGGAAGSLQRSEPTASGSFRGLIHMLTHLAEALHQARLLTILVIPPAVTPG